MSRDPRLSEEGADAFEAMLLRSARNDGASANRERTLAALALAGAAGAGATGAVGATKAKAGLAGALKNVGSLKWMAVIALGVAGGGVALLWPRAQLVDVAPPPIVEPVKTAPTAAEVEEPPAVVVPATEPIAAPPATARPRASGKSRAATSDLLLEEVSIVDRSRAQLRAGDGAAARKTAEVYLARFPEGRLTGEAMVIRIRAVSLTEGASAAAPLAAAFLRAHPNSPHAPSLRKILESAPASGGK